MNQDAVDRKKQDADNEEMNWTAIISELQAAGLSQAQVGIRIGKSQAWVSAAAAGKYEDLKWQDGEALRSLHREICGTKKEAA